MGLNNNVHEKLGQILDQKVQKDKTQLPFLKSWEQNPSTGSKGRALSMPPALSTTKGGSTPATPAAWPADIPGAAVVQSLSHVGLCQPVDRSPPGSPVRGISQAKNTELGCHFLLPGPRSKLLAPVFAGRFFTTEPPGKPRCAPTLTPFKEQACALFWEQAKEPVTRFGSSKFHCIRGSNQVLPEFLVWPLVNFS